MNAILIQNNDRAATKATHMLSELDKGGVQPSTPKALTVAMAKHTSACSGFHFIWDSRSVKRLAALIQLAKKATGSCCPKFAVFLRPKVRLLWQNTPDPECNGHRTQARS